eukprot:gene17103-20372_t
MRALDDEAKAAGVLLLNELGLDPGIDHMSSMKIIDAAKAANGKITKFVSWCGALPAKECAGNPFGYKFSWSPRGVLSSASLNATFLWEKQTAMVPAHVKFAVMQPIEIKTREGETLVFEGVANRDSFPYIAAYGMSKDEVTTMLRGTLRWPGFAIMVRALAALGLFADQPDARLTATPPPAWHTVIANLLGCNDNTSDLSYCVESAIRDLFTKQVKEAAASNFTFPIVQSDIDANVKEALAGIEWLGLLGDDAIIPKATPIDTLCALLERRLSYAAGERDIVVMQHEFVIEYSDRKEREISQLICYGQPSGSTATSLTVGIPVGIAVELIIDETVSATGVLGPVTPEFYLPILDRLKSEEMLRRTLTRLATTASHAASPAPITTLRSFSGVSRVPSSKPYSSLFVNNNYYNKSIKYSTNNNNNIVEAEEEDKPEDNLAIKDDQMIEETEKVVGMADKHEFQAETQKLLHIVAESLYTEKEVFIRELISNASDAIEKARHMQLTSQKIIDEDVPFEIRIGTDEDKKTLTIQDTGVGMSKEELIRNLGRIGYSGSGDFVKRLGENPDKASIIGQFGVGFYSSFMVGHTIKVYSRGAAPGSTGYLWESDGAGAYSISEAEGVARGTKIIIHLKPNAYEYAKKATVEGIIKKYSNFVGFPIVLNGSAVNTIRALWTLNKASITEDEHKAFYQFISKSYDNPTYRVHFATDTPLNIRSLFYIPSQHSEKYGMGRMEAGVSLFSRKVMIQPKAKGLLPEWMRFVRGVVDSEDIPLNVSREHLQDNGLIQRISQVLVKRILKSLDDESRRDPATFNTFMAEFSGFFKEGIITDFKWKDEISKLLRFESSHGTELCSLEAYAERMKPDQKQIYYITVPNRHVAMSSPYYEPFKAKDVEVFFLYNTLDDFVFSNIGHFGDKKIVSVESKEAEEFLASQDNADSKPADALSPTETTDFLGWVQETVGSKISAAKATTRPISQPAIIVDHESATFRRMMKMMDPSKQHEIPKQQVEFNMNHTIVLKLNHLRQSNPTVAKLVAEQIVDNALVTAGLFEDSREMVPRLNQLLESLLVNATNNKKE